MKPLVFESTKAIFLKVSVYFELSLLIRSFNKFSDFETKNLLMGMEKA